MIAFNQLSRFLRVAMVFGRWSVQLIDPGRITVEFTAHPASLQHCAVKSGINQRLALGLIREHHETIRNQMANNFPQASNPVAPKTILVSSSSILTAQYASDAAIRSIGNNCVCQFNVQPNGRSCK